MSIQSTIAGATDITIGKSGNTVRVDFDAMPQVSKNHIVAYGIRQILNDARASEKDDTKALGLVQKRLDNLMSGTLRASPIREGNPVRRRALELASEAVRAHPAFIAWVAGRKSTDKAVVAELRRQATVAVDKPGNRFTAQAEIDVAAAKELAVDFGDLDFTDAAGDEPDADESEDEAENSDE